MRTPGNSLPASRVRRVATLGILAIFALLVVAGCAVDKTGGDTTGLTTATAQNLVGLAPGTITSDDLTKAQTAEPFAAKLADLVDENRLAINITWLLVTGFLVMFMQAGFALVETGLHPGQERPAHDDDELHDLRNRHRRVLPGRFRDRLRRVGHGRGDQPRRIASAQP